METNVNHDKQQEPKRLSKWGEWIKNPDRETIEIVDMRAVLR